VARKRPSKKSRETWFKLIQGLTESKVNALMEMDMRGELVDTNRKGDKGVIRIGNRWHRGEGSRPGRGGKSA
jgi:hypothetical protein